MGVSSTDPSDPGIQLEVLRERLKNSEEKIRQLEGDLAQVYIDLGRKETELKQIRDDRDDLKIELAVAKSGLKHGQELLKLSTEKTRIKRNNARRRIFSANALHFLAPVLTGFGTGMLISTPPNSLGWMMIVFAAVVYFIGANLISTEGGEE